MSPIILRPVGLSWIDGRADDPADLCAHGRIEFRVGEDVVIAPDGSLEVTVSAAALCLLRTLEREHTKEAPVGDRIFPCCGFTLYEVGGPDVSIIGCPSGLDLEVRHGPGREHALVRADDGREWRIAWADWQAAVISFADVVSTFFASSSPKAPSAGDAAGFRSFVAEWERRRGLRFASRAP